MGNNKSKKRKEKRYNKLYKKFAPSKKFGEIKPKYIVFGTDISGIVWVTNMSYDWLIIVASGKQQLLLVTQMIAVSMKFLEWQSSRAVQLLLWLRKIYLHSAELNCK